MSLSELFVGMKEGFKSFGANLSAVVNFILLTLVYFIGVGLTSLIAKLAKKHFLDLDKSRPRKTYWTELNLKKKDIKEYYKQY